MGPERTALANPSMTPLMICRPEMGAAFLPMKIAFHLMPSRMPTTSSPIRQSATAPSKNQRSRRGMRAGSDGVGVFGVFGVFGAVLSVESVGGFQVEVEVVEASANRSRASAST